MQNNTGEATRFLNCIFRNCPDGSGNINLRCKDSNGKVHSSFISVDNIEDISSILSNDNDSDWWFAIALRNGHKGTKEGISLIPALHLDHDHLTPEIEKEIEAFLKPSSIVQSSLPTKKQFYWLLKEPVGPEEISKVENINLRLIHRFAGDRGTQDASRILRIPGTFNHKKEYGTPLQCRILELNQECQYSLDDLDFLAEVEETPKAKPIEFDTSSELWQQAQREITKRPRIMLHWMNPKPDDRSGHDWRLACLCLEEGITNPGMLYQIILHNPQGKAKSYPDTAKYIRDIISKAISQFSEAEVYSPNPKEDGRVNLDHVYDASRMIKEYEAYVHNLDKINFRTGVNPIDRKIRGVAGGEVLTIIARAGAFKTAMLQNILLNYIQNSAWGAAFFSLEMPVPSLTERYHEIISEVSGEEVERSYHNKEICLEEIQRKFVKTLSKLFVVPVKVDLKQIAQYVSLIESHYHIKVGVIGIDYLGLIDAPGPNEYEIISRLARDVKTLAKELSLPVVLLTQASRKAGSGETELTLDMGRGSGAIEEGADFVIGLFQSEKNNPSSQNDDPEYDLVAKILKNRKGPKNSMWKLDLDPKTLRLGHEAEPWTLPKKQRKGDDL
jgi:replicative DNA helicase